MTTAHTSLPAATRTRIVIHGAVQGVGFRPFVYRTAVASDLTGWVSNTPQGVIIEAEGNSEAVAAFVRSVASDKPQIAHIYSIEAISLDPAGYESFEIRESDMSGSHTAVVLPDIATCDDCIHELFDPTDRRYLYPFLNCTNCGPRFTIIDALPYDRTNTSMRDFVQCPACMNEYVDPSNRRFHAQPNACPVCGPSVTLVDRAQRTLAEGSEVFPVLSDRIRRGDIAAVKGLGGFHLVCDAIQAGAVRTLRNRKRREEKPFAIMVPDLSYALKLAELSKDEEELLASPESPIVLVRRRDDERSLDEATPAENPYLGLMLPYTPIHHILLREIDGPVIATSGNLSDEPICIEESDAINRLNDIADVFLMHNRPIRRHADDSIVRVVRGQQQVMRRARGFAPLPVHAKHELGPVLAVGAHVKNTIAVSSGHRIVVSQHIGDLETVESMHAFRGVIDDLPRLHGILPESVACDLHPDYLSTQFAGEQHMPTIPVQHHVAHVYACMAENEIEGPVLGVSWDGTGLGTDGTIWGGEFIRIVDGSWHRFAHLHTFALPGGDAAVKEPRRCAVALLHEISDGSMTPFGDLAPMMSFPDGDRRTIVRMLDRSLNAPLTSSAGRLFDAVASLLDIRHIVRHEGQAAMNLEWLASRSDDTRSYPMTLSERADDRILDWRPMIGRIIEEIRSRQPAMDIARRFHTSLAEGICLVAQKADVSQILLTGGCFQNLLLTEMTTDILKREGLRVYTHQRIPTNDGGIAVGQAYAAGLMTGADREISAAAETA